MRGISLEPGSLAGFDKFQPEVDCCHGREALKCEGELSGQGLLSDRVSEALRRSPQREAIERYFGLNGRSAEQRPGEGQAMVYLIGQLAKTDDAVLIESALSQLRMIASNMPLEPEALRALYLAA